MLHKDERVKIMAEILRGIRVIKFHVWEDHFVDKTESECDMTGLINITVLMLYRNILATLFIEVYLLDFD
jgi:hypothetical protein